MKTGFVCPSGFNMIGSATRNGRTLVAVVLGEDNAISRAEAAAKLLDMGFAMPASGVQAGAATVQTLPSYGDSVSENNMRAEICAKKPASAQSEAPAAAEKDKPKSPYQIKLTAPTLVAVGLGGATGPLPKAMIGRVEYADVPTPSWRPDKPSPFAGATAAAEGDQ
jgi:D-alanyl-D-alanine carboxypeptidase